MYFDHASESRTNAPRIGSRLWKFCVVISVMLSTRNCRVVHDQLGRRLGIGGQLEDDLDAVDPMRLERLFDQVGGRNQRDRAERDALAQAGIDLAAFAARQHRAELEQRAAEHRVARDHVFAHRRRHEARGRPDRHLARRHVVGADDPAHAAEVIDVAVRIDDRDHRLVAADASGTVPSPPWRPRSRSAGRSR